jgi:hypothetical protein
MARCQAGHFQSHICEARLKRVMADSGYSLIRSRSHT